MTDQEIIAYFLGCYQYEEGVTVDSNGQGPRRHLPLSQEIRDEFDKRLADVFANTGRWVPVWDGEDS